MNVEHHLVKYLEHREDTRTLPNWRPVIYEQAMLAEGAQLPDRARSCSGSTHVDAAAVGLFAIMPRPATGVARCTQVAGQFIHDDI
jgi:hypothetical protein